MCGYYFTAKYVLQDDSDVEEEDDFVELAYFKTWIAVRNTLQQVEINNYNICYM